jgi:uncharacterized protein (TIGR01777 family)
MRIVIAGGSGFLGSALARHLAGRGHDVVILTRQARRSDGRIRNVEWAPDGHPGPWAKEIDGAGAVVNLAGAGIADRRWTAKRKAELRSSRVYSTRSLVAAVRVAAAKPAVFVQGSAVGYYGTNPEPTFDESCPPGDDFFGQLAVAWEAEAHPLSAIGVRLVIVRTAPALDRHGGALKKMVPPFTFFVGGPLASGRQVMSWIHLDDWVALVTWAIDTPAASGVYNATSPAPVTNAEFSKALGRALHRPSWLPVPGFVLRILVGELAPVALINGQRVVPKRALEAGFKFKYPTIEEGMNAAIKSRPVSP